MVDAIILTKVDAGKDREVLDKAKMLDGVKHACATYGVYDLYIQASFQSIEALDRFVFHELRAVPFVRETVTLICSSFVC